jgi:hypothetical protein
MTVDSVTNAPKTVVSTSLSVPDSSYEPYNHVSSLMNAWEAKFKAHTKINFKYAPREPMGVTSSAPVRYAIELFGLALSVGGGCVVSA